MFPGYASMVQYLTGETKEDRQKWREDILSTNEKDIKLYAEKLKAVVEKGNVVVFGSKTAIEATNGVINGKPIVVESALTREA
jgi:Zn-dependent M16 (insulinase) family peptidase